MRYCLKVLGDKVIMVTTAGCTGPGSGGSLVHNGKRIDTIGTPFGNIAMFAGGISSALKAQGDTETLVVGWGGDGATFDIGFGGISASAERNEDFLFICVDNEGYQNTGNQRSSASPWMSTGATTPPGFAKMEYKKDIGTILAAHRVPYVATATVGYPDDLMAKVEKAKNLKGFRFLHIYIPCPAGWGCASERTMEISRLVVDTKVFPIYEVENGINLTISRQPKERPLSDYLGTQRRFNSITAEQVSNFEKDVEERWRRLQFLASYG
jgi:pyruvate ferredoxin oxidoreductase beta subunit/2-oxoisovalerate ferredoxin oxidoreductase beta subunit